MTELVRFLENRVREVAESAAERARIIRENYPDIYQFVLDIPGAKLAWIKSEALTWSRDGRYENPPGVANVVLESLETPEARARRAAADAGSAGVRGDRARRGGAGKRPRR